MNYTLDDVKRLQTEGCTNYDLERLLDDCDEILEKDLEPESEMDRLVVCTTQIAGIGEEYVDRMLSLLYRFRSRIHSGVAIAKAEYAFMSVFRFIGFTPKVVEHALNICDSNENCYHYKFAAAKEIAAAAIEAGFVDRAIEYANKEFEYGKLIGSFDNRVLEIINESTVCYYLSFSDRRDELRAHKQKLNDLLEAYRDDPNVEKILWSVTIDKLYIESKMTINLKNIVKEYKDLVFDVTSGRKEYSAVYHSINSDVLLLKRFLADGYVKDAAYICKRILKTPNCFSGDMSDLYAILFKAYNIDSSALSTREYEKMSMKYINMLIKTKASTENMLSRMISDQFTARDISKQNPSYKVKVEKDPLKVSYNRPGFELNAAQYIDVMKTGSLILTDIVNLSKINEEYGHGAGDLLLKAFVKTADRLLDPLTERLYRFSGSEFIIMTDRKSADADLLVSQMLETFETPVVYNNSEIKLTIRTGIVAFDEIDKPKEGDTDRFVEELVRAAAGKMVSV